MEICKGDGPFHGCVFSRSMNQEYPRKCVKCGNPEQAELIQLTKHFVPNDKTRVRNFSMIRHAEACVNVYDKDCMGCKSVGADFMLTFGSTIDVLDGNNQITACEGPKHVDVFITRKQAEGLFVQLSKKLYL